MDIFLHDPHEIPLPPEEVRIRDLRAEPLSDGRRVRVTLEVDPFQKRPSASLTIIDAASALLAEASVIESMDRKIELILHLRPAGSEIALPYTLAAVLFYLPPLPAPGEDVDPAAVGRPQVIDRRSIQFAR
jgi:hypothetical protein